MFSGIDFEMYDPSAISGVINYTGSAFPGCCYTVYVGAFDTTGFDVNNIGDPDFGTEANWWNEPMYAIGGLDEFLTDGTYYVGAYLDGNNNFTLDPGEPMALYGGMTPTPITVANGSDALDIDITLSDAQMFTVSSWTRPAPDMSERAIALRRLAELFRRAQQR